MQVVQEVYGVNDGNLAKAAIGFGGGIARKQSECGALVGGVMALGLKHGTSVVSEKAPEADAARQAIRKESQALLAAFAAKFGETYCRSLTGYDFSDPEGDKKFREDAAARKRCGEYVEFVIRHLTR